MNLLSFLIESDRRNSIQNGLLSYNKTNNSNKQILEGMSPQEIADIVSDHLIEIVKKQFQEAKEKYHREMANKAPENTSVLSASF